MGWYDEELNQPRLLAAKLATEASAVKGVATENVGMTMQVVIMMIAGMVLAFYFGWQLALVTLGMGPIIVFSTKLQMNFLQNTSSDSKLALEKSSQVASESLAGIRTISAFANEIEVHHRYAFSCACVRRVHACKRIIFFTRTLCVKFLRYSDCLIKPLELGMKKANLAGVGLGLGQLVLMWTMALTFWFGGWLISRQHMDFASVLKVSLHM